MSNRPSTTEPLWRTLRRKGKVRPEALLDLFGIRQPPVPVDLMARDLGVEIVETDDSEAPSGQLDVVDDQAIITLQAADPPRRKRFTIAHELAHLMQDVVGNAYLVRDSRFGADSPMERRADAFAADLLMPHWMVSAHLRAVKTIDYDAFAELYQVSLPAMRVRIDVVLGLR